MQRHSGAMDLALAHRRFLMQHDHSKTTGMLT